MTVYGFHDKGNAQALNRFASDVLGKTNEGRQRIGEDALIVKIPVGEVLVGRTGADVCTLLCDIQQLGTDATLSDSGNTCLVYNKGTNSFGEGEYLDVVRQKSLWIAIAGGSSVKTFLSSSEITVRSGNTAGTGTAVSYTYNDNTGDFDTGTESPAFSIINPYAQSVSNGVVIQAKPAEGGKWELIQAECEDTLEVE